MKKRGLGWTPDPKHRRPRTAFRAPRGAVLSGVTPWSIRQHVRGIPDQGPLGACTGVSLVHALRTYDVANGVGGSSPHDAPVYGSALAAYWGGRFEDFAESSGTRDVAAFVAQDSDRGSSHASVCAAIATFGLPPEGAWAYDPVDTGSADDPYRRRPAGVDPVALEHRADLEVLSLDDEDPNQRILDLNHAGATKHPVLIGLDVDQRFIDEKFDPAVAYAPDATKTVGGHALYLAAMRIGSTGEREYLAPMSWGSDPPEFEYIWLPELTVLAPTTQLTVVRRAPIYTGSP